MGGSRRSGYSSTGRSKRASRATASARASSSATRRSGCGTRTRSLCSCSGGKLDVLYTTSANLNANKRLENFTLFAGGDMPREYLAAVEELWKLQRPGEAFDGGTFLARPHTEQILGVEKLLKRRAELAAALGRSAKQINKLVDAGMPVARRGARGAPHGYRLEDAERWLAEHEAKIQGRTGGEFLDPVRERALKERAQRYLAEQTLKVRAGELVAKDEVIAEWSGHAAAVRTKLASLPDVLSLDAVTRGAMQALIRQVLEELADGNDDPPATVKAPPAARSKRRAKGSKAPTSRKRATKRKAKARGLDVRPGRPAKAKRKPKARK